MGLFDKLNFEKLNASVTNAGRTVSQKVKNSNEISKLNSEINTEKRSIQQNLAQIGQLYYDICGDNPDEGFRELVEAVKKSEAHITELEKEIEIVRAREPELVPVPENAPAKENPVNSPSAMVCMNCGNTYEAGNTFCAVCGQKLTAQYPSAAAAADAPVQTAADVQIQKETPAETSPQPEIIEAKIEVSEITETPETSAFCPYCGRKLDTPDQAICPHCGESTR